MQGRVAAPIFLSDEERSFLEGQVRRHKVSRSLSDRCRIILLCAEGLPSKTVASQLGVHEHTVGKWRRRFVQDRIEGLTDEYRAGRPRTVSDAQVAEVIKQTLETTPKDATHWSIRSMASATGLSHTTIHYPSPLRGTDSTKFWRRFGGAGQRVENPSASSAIGNRCHQHTELHQSHRACLWSAVARLTALAARVVLLFPTPCQSNLLDSEAYPGYIEPERYHPKASDPPSSHQRRLNHNLLISLNYF